MNDLMITRRPNRKPRHPGDVLREDVLPAMQESVAGFASRTGISRQSIHAILSVFNLDIRHKDRSSRSQPGQTFRAHSLMPLEGVSSASTWL